MSISESEYQQMENELKRLNLESQQSKLDQQRQDVVMQQDERGMIEEQLDVSEILNNMYYLLKGYVLTRNEQTGGMKWTAPSSNDMVILSDYGVNYILGAVQWYVNKNTLLSNYEDEVILWKMEDFATTLADNVFMDYDNMFCYPTLEDCKKEIEVRIKRKVDVKVFALELLNKKVNREEIEKEVMKDMENRIQKEFEIIKAQKLKSKMKRFESIIRFVQDTVHSAYNRAWKGQERRTLREHIHITESKGGLGLINNQPKFTMNPIKLMGGNKIG